MKPEVLWTMSSKAYHSGHLFKAKTLKMLNYVLFRCVLPYECEIGAEITFWHRALGTVIHPSIKVGNKVQIAHGVTIAGSGRGISEVGDGVIVAANAVIIPKAGMPFKIGSGAIIGAGAIVVGDVPENAVMVGNPAKNTRC